MLQLNWRKSKVSFLRHGTQYNKSNLSWLISASSNHLSIRLEKEGGVSVLRLSKPLKKQYAEDHGLDLARLMDSSSYKETHRQAMILWGEEMRDKDPGYFCRLAVSEATKPVWLVCDARRPTDMEFFKTHYGSRTITVRVEAGEGVKRGRGWVFTPGVDDAPSECGLDGYQCDVVVRNNGDTENDSGETLHEQLDRIVKLVQKRL